MITKTRNRLIGLQRHFLWNQVKNHQSYFVSEFPKSGGTWFCQMLSDLVEVPFPRNQFIRSRSYIMHSHLLIHEKLLNPIVVIRDGRDVMISAYYHFLIPNDHCPDHEQRKWRHLIRNNEIGNVRRNLFQFIKVFHQKYRAGGQNITWQEHTLKSTDQSCLIVKYEDLLKDTKKELIRTTEYLNISSSDTLIDSTISKYSFETLKKQNPNSNFLRKGIKGDWENYFTRESGKLFQELGGTALSKFGYTSDSFWYEKLHK